MRTVCVALLCLLAVSSNIKAVAADVRQLASGGSAGYAEIEDFSLNLGINASSFRYFIRGALIGIGISEDWQGVEPCIKANEDAVGAVQTAIENFKTQNGTMDILNGLANIGKALTELPTSVQSCGGSAKDVRHLFRVLAAINSTKDFLWRVTKNIILCPTKLYDLIQKAVFYYKAGNMESFGVNIGQLLDEVLFVEVNVVRISSANMTDENEAELEAVKLPNFDASMRFNTSNFKAFVKGFLSGVGSSANWTQLVPCVHTNKDILGNLNLALVFFLRKDAMEAIYGLAAFGHALMDLPIAAQKCVSAAEDIADSIKTFKKLNGTKGFAGRIFRNAMVNSLDIYFSVTRAKAAYEAGDYETFGFNVGAMLNQVILDDIQIDNSTSTQALFSVTEDNKIVQEFLAF